MTIDNQIMDKKIQYDINREPAKISSLSSGKIDKYECLTDEKILPFDQSRIIEQANCTHSPLNKPFKWQMKTIEDQEIKQVEVLKALKPEENKEDIKSTEEFFQKRWELTKLKMKYMKLKNKKIKLNKKI